MRGMRIQEESGFGMIEVLVAVVLYAVALVSLMGLLITSVTAGSISDSSAVAVNLARHRIEGLRTLNIPTLLAEDCVSPTNVTTERVPAGQGRVYTLTVSCNNQPAYVDVTVRVNWNVGGAQSYSRTLQTRAAK